MIVVDTSVFIDLLFEYDSERTHSSEELFSILEENALPIMEPDLFRWSLQVPYPYGRKNNSDFKLMEIKK